MGIRFKVSLKKQNSNSQCRGGDSKFKVLDLKSCRLGKLHSDGSKNNLSSRHSRLISYATVEEDFTPWSPVRGTKCNFKVLFVFHLAW